MPYSAIFIPNYLTISLRQPQTTITAAKTSLHLRHRLHFCPINPRRLLRPQPPSPPLVALKLHRGLAYWRPAFAASCSAVSSSGLNPTLGFSASLPYFHYQDSPYGRLAYDEYASEDDSDREVESGQLGASSLDNIEEWKWKLTMLMRNKDEQEVVSRERKDRRDFDHLSILATRMGLYSRQYTKVVVVSKVPLPNYRSDLDDKRPQREESPEGQKMLEFRRSLPAYIERDTLLNSISQNQVVVVSGETGCGKTTQLPQYILESEIEAAQGAVCSIVCTQPRRISAMAVSERVAAERGENLGESVGYKVRLEGMKGKDTRLLFCTTGILLRRLLVDRSLKGVTHVIVDEIHERGMNEDFLLIVLKDLLPRRPELRLILMSATLNAELFSSYFDGAPMIHIPKLIFDKPGDGVRKIVLATNMAETSITIDDVVFVVDCGKAKETSYDALNNTPCLLPSWISKASARQRRGRAGRVQPGECYHLYPRCVYDAFADYQLPELLRTPLQSLCLQIKSLKLGSISEFLSRALQPPEPLSVQNAIEYLKIIGALDENENLTVLGHNLSMLPVEPKLGKMLLLGSIFNCLDPIMTVVAGLSVRDPFLMPLDKKDLAESAKAQFSARDYSDHLALVRAYEGWREAEGQKSGYEYCWRNFLSAQTLKAIDSLRKQFFYLLKDIGLVDNNIETCNTWSHDGHLVRAIICAGLFPGICSVVNKEKSISLKTMEDGQVLLYSNSVNAQELKIPHPWLVFNEKVKVNSVFLRDSTAVSDSVVLLFGGNISRGGLDGHLKMLGGYLEFFMKPALADTYLRLKKELEELVQKKLLNPKLDIKNHEELLSSIRLLVSEDRCEGRFVFGRQMPTSSKKATKGILSKSSDGGGDNSKNQLQTLLCRAGHGAPTYKTTQLKNKKFRSTLFFNGLDFVGQPASNKKLAEKDAAAQALQWLMGETQSSHKAVDHMSMLLKKSKKKHKVQATKWR
ncbi:DExH-box ATP-dependent RNA helicase [Actinidia chinensis var. chinensis]|uniref:RNA helicase n=1 Tax=Actinidia chinensis var. chinensis TaxID=1590841 RepID=A0A2R6PCG3_ACTCC|nr:DExH-box ATP-dependent RNA helicase [Actinidia chinensis var. chinensis]